MKLTVQPAVSDRPVKPDGVEPWANREVRPVLARLREAANFVGTERTDVTSLGDGEALHLWESDEMPQDATWAIQARVAVSGPSYGDQLARATAISVAGTVTIPVQTVVWSEGAIGDVAFGISERKIRLVGEDDGANPHRFVSVVEVVEALEP